MEDVDLLNRTETQAQRNVWKTLRSLIEHLLVFRVRIIVAFVFLILAKVATINVPITLKKIVDWFDAALNPESILIVPVFLIVSYGLLSLASTLCEELRNALFSRAQQRAARNIALEVFQTSPSTIPCISSESTDRRNFEGHRTRDPRHHLSALVYRIQHCPNHF